MDVEDLISAVESLDVRYTSRLAELYPDVYDEACKLALKNKDYKLFQKLEDSRDDCLKIEKVQEKRSEKELLKFLDEFFDDKCLDVLENKFEGRYKDIIFIHRPARGGGSFSQSCVKSRSERIV